MLTAGAFATLAVLCCAGDAPDCVAVDQFQPRHAEDLVGLQDVDFDSGWLPMGSPVQLRFYAHAADSIVVEMLGDAEYDWDADAIAFYGDPDAGLFLLDVGLELQASVRFDVAGIQWESDILGPWDYAITSEAQFTPFLLPGHPQRPIEIDDQTDGATVASVPIVPDIIVASGNLEVDVAADITARLEGRRIEVSSPDDAAIVDAWQIPSPLLAGPGDEPLYAEGVMVAGMQTAPTLIVRPHLVMSILGQDFEIIGIDVPIALPPTDDEIIFDPEPLEFPRPEPPPAPGTSSGEGGLDGSGGGGQEVGDDESGVAASSSGGESDGDTDGDSAGLSSGEDGCGCRGDRPTHGTLALLLLAVMASRRRQQE